MCVVGGALVDTVAKTIWATVVDRAEGQLRSDLLDAAMAQPLAELSEQAVGEVLDRIDDDTWEVGQLMRWGVWQAARTFLASGPLWVVASLTWWPAAFLFPVTALVAFCLVRRLLPQVAQRKVLEEAAWTDHAASTEEGVAARDDLRTSLGQAHVLRRNAHLASVVHRTLDAVLLVETRITRRSGGLLHGALAAVAVLGIAFVLSGDLSTARLVTLFLVTTMFVGRVDMLARHLPDLQEGFGAVLRLRGMLASPRRADRRAAAARRSARRGVPSPAIQLRHRHASRCATSTCWCRPATPAPSSAAPAPASPPWPRCSRGPSSRRRGTVLLGGTDVLDLDLQQLRAAVGVVTQRTEVLAGTLADNITLFGDVPRATVEAAIAELGLTDWVAGLPAGLDTVLGPGGTSLSAGEEQLVAFARLLVRDVQRGRARRGHRPDGPGHRGAGRACRRPADLGPHRHPGRAPALHDRAGRAGRRPGVRAGRAAGSARAARRRGRTVPRAARRGCPRGRSSRSTTTTTSAIGSVRRSTDSSAATGRSRRRRAWPGRCCTRSASSRSGACSGRSCSCSPPSPAPSAPSPAGSGATSSPTSRPASGPAGSPSPSSSRSWSARCCSRRRSAPTPTGGWRCGCGCAPPCSTARPRSTGSRRTPPGEVVARTMDADRLARYTDRWVDFVNGLVVAAVTALIAGTWLAGAVLLAVMVASALASTLGRRVAGRSAAAASTSRARFGQSLVSALESVRTVKLAAATPQVHAHLRAGRRRAGRRGGARAPRPGAARRRPRRDGPVRRRRRLGRSAHRRVGARHRPARRQRRQRLRLVRPRRRLGRHRGARRAGLDDTPPAGWPAAAT